MKIDELIAKLNEYIEKYGNLDVIGPNDTPISGIMKHQDFNSKIIKLVVRLY